MAQYPNAAPDRKTVAREAAQLQDAENAAGHAMREGGPTPPPISDEDTGGDTGMTPEEQFMTREKTGLGHLGREKLIDGRTNLVTQMATQPSGPVYDQMEVLLKRIEQQLEEEGASWFYENPRLWRNTKPHHAWRKGD